MKQFRIQSQRGEIEFDLPSGIEGVQIAPRSLPPPLTDVEAEIDGEVKGSLGQLQNKLAGAQRVGICVTDITRKCHEAEILKVLTRALQKMKIGPDKVSIVVAQGSTGA